MAYSLSSNQIHGNSRTKARSAKTFKKCLERFLLKIKHRFMQVSPLYFYFEVVFQFLLSLAVVVGNVTDDVPVLQEGDTGTDVHRVVEVVT